MKTYRQSADDRWAAEDITYVDDKILLLFEWGGTYHNVTSAYNVEKPTEPSTEPTTQIIPLGDVNNDGVICIKDATELQMYLAQLIELTDKQLEFADVNKDTVISIKDVTLIQMFIAEIITEF